MTDQERTEALREMARIRGFRLIKSRRRKRGGDRGKFGLTELESGREVLGFGDKGLEATGKDIEAFLREQAGDAWLRSARPRRSAKK